MSGHTCSASMGIHTVSQISQVWFRYSARVGQGRSRLVRQCGPGTATESQVLLTKWSKYRHRKSRLSRWSLQSGWERVSHIATCQGCQMLVIVKAFKSYLMLTYPFIASISVIACCISHCFCNRLVLTRYLSCWGSIIDGTVWLHLKQAVNVGSKSMWWQLCAGF